MGTPNVINAKIVLTEIARKPIIVTTQIVIPQSATCFGAMEMMYYWVVLVVGITFVGYVLLFVKTAKIDTAKSA